MSGKTKKINLALQGGGAHGAYAWGILDFLLEDGRIEIDGLSATSAGAMNAAVLAYGLHQGGAKNGPERAREMLHEFWRKISDKAMLYNPVNRMPWERMMGWNLDQSPLYFMFDFATRSLSPYQFNPLNFDPLREIVEEMIDFEALAACTQIRLFISTTHVKTGKIRVFNTDEVSADVIMASACLPFLFQAVEIEGESYWDGGYTGNPALYPFFYRTESRDIVIVHINPIERPDVPTSAPDIMNRINEISFNDSLIKEMRAIAFVKKLIERDMLKDEHKDRFRDMLVHSIRADGALCDLSVASKFSAEWDFLTYLRDKGRDAAKAWLADNYKHLGARDTVDLDQEFIASVGRLFAEKSP